MISAKTKVRLAKTWFWMSRAYMSVYVSYSVNGYSLRHLP